MSQETTAMEGTVEVAVVANTPHALPSYSTPDSAGMDLRAKLEQPITLQPGQRALVPTGLHMALPQGYEAQVRPRSGLAYKHGVTVLNSPGTIDADYRGDVGVILINHGQEPFVVEDGERIAQLVIAKYERVAWQVHEAVDALPETVRGSGGFGHTGTT
jgi:dUTP pyrophosphatase